jgi:hypothetical protein
MMFSSVFVARQRESLVLPRTLIGMALTLVGALLEVLLAPAGGAEAMAVVLAAGQVTTVVLLAHKLSRIMPSLAGKATTAAAGATLLAGVSIIGAAVPNIRLEIGCLLLAAAFAVLVSQLKTWRAYFRDSEPAGQVEPPPLD